MVQYVEELTASPVAQHWTANTICSSKQQLAEAGVYSSWHSHSGNSWGLGVWNLGPQGLSAPRTLSSDLGLHLSLLALHCLLPSATLGLCLLYAPNILSVSSAFSTFYPWLPSGTFSCPFATVADVATLQLPRRQLLLYSKVPLWRCCYWLPYQEVLLLTHDCFSQ